MTTATTPATTPPTTPPATPSTTSPSTTDVGAVEQVTTTPPSAESVRDEMRRIAAERDEYLEALQRLQAEYDNYRRRAQREQTEQLARGEQRVAERLLDVLDGFDSGVAHGLDALLPLQRMLTDALTAGGLERLEPLGRPFDPALHHAVEHEAVEHEAVEQGADQDGGHDQATVVEVLRAGYRWRDRLLRPALVKVRG